MERRYWKVKTLGEVVEFLDGRRVPLKDSDRMRMQGEIPYYGANGQIDSIDKYIFDEPLVLLAEDGGHFGSKTKPIAYKIEGKSWVNNHAHVLKPIQGLDIDFLKWSLAFYNVSKFTTGSTRVKLTKGDAMKMQIPFPDLKTQQKIAGILTQADAARQKRKQANQLTEQFLQSAFLEMFGDPVRNEKGWEIKRFEEFSERTQIGPFGTQLHEEDYVENGIPLINPKHIVDGRIEIDLRQTIIEEKFNTLSNYHLQIGDVVMARRGEMGRCALITEKENGWLCGTGSLFIRPGKIVNPIYLIFAMRQKSFVSELENRAQGVTMMNLNLAIVNNLPLPLPPLPLQQKFAALVEQVERLRTKQRESERELDNLFQSLMQRYFG